MVDPADPPDRKDPASELRPARVRPRWWGAPAVLVAVVAAGLVSLAVLARLASPPLRPAATSPAPAAFVPATEAAPRSRAIPPALDCHGLARADCLEIVRAALAILPGDLPDVATAGAWGSLLCDSALDCSPSDLALATPRGSVVISFADGGSEAWLNVVDRPVTGRPAPVTQAWIVAWMAPPVARPSASVGAVRGP